MGSRNDPRPDRRIPLSTRLWAKTTRETGDKCWLWRGTTAGGYGQIRSGDGKNIGAHVAAYLITHGDIPDELDVCHTCDTPGCVRPDHLFIATPLQNIADMITRGRMIRPGRRALHTTALLTVDQLSAIQTARDMGIPVALIARLCSVTPKTIYRLKRTA